MSAPVLIQVFDRPRWSVNSDGNAYLDGHLAKTFLDHGRVMCHSGYRGSGYHAQPRAILVCTAWHGPKPFPSAEVRHLNDIHDDDRPFNLAWGTHQQNIQDAVRNGTHNFVGNKYAIGHI